MSKRKEHYQQQNNKIMNATLRNSIIEDLNRVINHYVYNSRLFAGGCCYSAYVLAKNLERLGIKYRTVLFQYDEILNETNFNNAIRGDGVSHVAIEVTYRRKKFIIGDCRRIYTYFKITKEPFKIMKYADIKSADLLKGYRENEWNYMYNPKNNGPLMRDITRVANKYAEVYMNR